MTIYYTETITSSLYSNFIFQFNNINLLFKSIPFNLTSSQITNFNYEYAAFYTLKLFSTTTFVTYSDITMGKTLKSLKFYYVLMPI